MSNRTIKGSVAFVVAAVLAGCAVGPDYKKPDTPVAAKFAGAEESTFSAQDAQAQFWTQFGDDTLNHLVDDAFAANHDLRIALGHLAEARATRRQSLYDLAPTVTAQAGHQTQQLPASQFGFPFKASFYAASFD